MVPIETVITQALQHSNIKGYGDSFKHLGGGELNDTYVLNFEDGKKLVLRISKYDDQTSLKKEAKALALLDNPRVPHLIYFDKNQRINNKLWTLESFVPGESVERLNRAEFQSLGSLLADIHAVAGDKIGINAWQDFLINCRKFGDEAKLLNYPNPTLRQLILSAKSYFESFQPILDGVMPALVHGDATPNNLLISHEEVSLIDWEFARFRDPMAEFSTIYYEDMGYNRGKWRVHITPEEQNALYNGYRTAGGTIDEERIKFWMICESW